MAGQEQNRRADDPRIEALQRTMERMETHMMRLADAVSKLAVIEERQSTDRATINKMAESIEKIDARLDALEQQAPMTAQTNEWVGRAVWAAAAAAATYVMTKIFGIGG